MSLGLLLPPLLPPRGSGSVAPVVDEVEDAVVGRPTGGLPRPVVLPVLLVVAVLFSIPLAPTLLRLLPLLAPRPPTLLLLLLLLLLTAPLPAAAAAASIFTSSPSTGPRKI